MNTFHIFAGGEISDLSFVEIASDDTVICADRGLVHIQKLGIKPHLIVGDFDSYTEVLPEDIEIHRSLPEKDDTDTMLALKLAIERGAERVIIYGAFGGRLDHTIANIQTLRYAQENGCEAVLMDSDNIALLQSVGTRTYPYREGWYFSFFAYTDKVVVSLSGTKYTLDNAEITSSFPLGVSNEITSDEAVMTVSEGTALIVISKM
ncbi:MAG: thiamine diphosphokinase [Ruminococcus sp.]|nr:thiamine diphosphokinase [Ruminococcus sp.]